YGDEQWAKMIAGRNFKSLPGFGTTFSGNIALKDNGYNVCFRNIQIKRL
ncbi:MAG: hypothetical protein RL181_1695, partial [Bacteroidota bacterium]